MKLSNQAMGAIMMALQKSLLEQSDIVPVLNSFKFELDNSEELVVRNPPNFTVSENSVPTNQTTKETKATTGSD
jgi:hypothetical protein